MKSKRGKLSKRVIAVIVTAVTAAILFLGLIITDIFIPLRYLTAYFVGKDVNGEGTMRVSFVDVDFGDCILIELPDGKNVLIDGGDGAYPNTLKALHFLNSRGIDRIDYLICSSVSDEHCGGLAEIVEYKDVGYAFIPYCTNTRITEEYHTFITKLESKGVIHGVASVGAGIMGEKGEYFLTFLSPVNYNSPQSEYADMNSDPNAENIENASVVTWLEYDGVAFIFTSDVRSTGLKRMVEEFSLCEELGQPYCTYGGRSVNLRECKILTAPAHGGKDNTYAPWYDLIKPEETVISVGKSFANYPSLKALSDICNYCDPLYTMYDGDITFTVNDGGYTVTKSKNSK